MTANGPTDENAAELGERDLSLHVFSISAGMVGVCLTGIGLLRVTLGQPGAATIGDEVLAADAILFLACCVLSFWSFKARRLAHRRVLRWTTDLLFLVALMVMAAVCTVLTYAIA
jgi:hypothetical protein